MPRTASERWQAGRQRVHYAVHDRLLSNRASRRAHGETAPALSDAQRAAAAALERDGIAVAHFDDLVGDAGLWQELAGDMAAFRAEAEAELAAGPPASPNPSRAWKPFLIRRHRERAHTAADPRAATTFDAGDPRVRFSLHHGMLGVVNAYRGLQTRLIEFDQWYTVPVGAGTEPARSQNWHRDPEDRHVVKAFVYFSDVDEDAGPFAYVPGSRPGARYGSAWPWTFSDRNPYPPPDRFGERVPEEDVVTVTGGPGTVILCDTSGFHRGGHARTRARLLSLHVYVSPAALVAGTSRRRFSVDGAAHGGPAAAALA